MQVTIFLSGTDVMKMHAEPFGRVQECRLRHITGYVRSRPRPNLTFDSLILYKKLVSNTMPILEEGLFKS